MGNQQSRRIAAWKEVHRLGVVLEAIEESPWRGLVHFEEQIPVALRKRMDHRTYADFIARINESNDELAVSLCCCCCSIAACGICTLAISSHIYFHCVVPQHNAAMFAAIEEIILAENTALAPTGMVWTIVYGSKTEPADWALAVDDLDAYPDEELGQMEGILWDPPSHTGKQGVSASGEGPEVVLPGLVASGSSGSDLPPAYANVVVADTKTSGTEFDEKELVQGRAIVL